MSRRYNTQRLRTQLRSIEFTHFYRIIHQQHAITPLGAVPSPSRFSDPDRQYAVLYASESVRCSFWEAVVRSRLSRQQRRELPYADIEQRQIVTLASTHVLSLLDLRHDGPMRIGAPTAVTHDARHQAGRVLSSNVYTQLPETDGFLFLSRFIGHACVAIFDRAIAKLHVKSVTPLIEHADVLDALDDYDITLTTPPLE